MQFKVPDVPPDDPRDRKNNALKCINTPLFVTQFPNILIKKITYIWGETINNGKGIKCGY